MALWSDSSKYACTFPIQMTFTLLYQMVNLIFAKYLYGIFVHILYQLLFNITNHRKGFACCGCSYPKLNCRLSLYSYRWSFFIFAIKGFRRSCLPSVEGVICLWGTLSSGPSKEPSGLLRYMKKKKNLSKISQNPRGDIWMVCTIVLNREQNSNKNSI